MCGICGISGPNPSFLEPHLLQAMALPLKKRGPDGEGFFYKPHVALAHLRLAILDLETGAQPMTSEDGRYTIVFNGEIYNYQTLKADLIKQNETFKTQSDTEVLLKLLIRKGPQALYDLSGMFALALWDAHEQTLFCARDPMGKKPFYYHLAGDTFIFASELKSILKHPLVKPQLNPKAVASFFTFESVPEPLSMIEGVHKLSSGHHLTFQKGLVSIERYFTPSFKPTLDLSENEAGTELFKRLDLAVEQRLISDVPLGLFLSGGLDSSAVLALMARHREAQNINTFSIHFNEASYDESFYSNTLVQKFKTNHSAQTLSAKKMLDILPSVAQTLDEPLADGSILPTWLLSSFTKQKVTVALSGDGADEIFCGYPTFWVTPLAVKMDKAPLALHKLMQFVCDHLPKSTRNLSFDFKLKQFLLAHQIPTHLKNQIWLSAIAPKDQPQLFTSAFLSRTNGFDGLSLITDELKKCDSTDLGDELLHFYQKFYLQSDLLFKTDRASMAYGLEVRAPFLDKNVVNFVNHLPYSYKLKGVTTKYLLKKIFNRHLPALITQRPKKGFGIPMAGWLKQELKDLLITTLNQKRIESDGIFSWPKIEYYITSHLSGKENQRKPLFSLLMLHLWMDNNLS